MSEQFAISSPYAVWHPPINTTAPTTPQTNDQIPSFPSSPDLPSTDGTPRQSNKRSGREMPRRRQALQRVHGHLRGEIRTMSHFGNIERAENAYEENLAQVELEFPEMPEDQREDLAAERTKEQLEAEDYWSYYGNPALTAAERNR